jgi:HEAT repeat protein
MLHDPVPLVRASVAGTLGKIGAPDAASYLQAVLSDPDSGVRWQAIRALSFVGSAQDLPFLEALLADDSEIFGSSIAAAAGSAIRSIKNGRQDQVKQTGGRGTLPTSAPPRR